MIRGRLIRRRHRKLTGNFRQLQRSADPAEIGVELPVFVFIMCTLHDAPSISHRRCAEAVICFRADALRT